MIRSKAKLSQSMDCLAIMKVEISKSVKGALVNYAWFKSMKEEYDALMRNETYKLVPCLKDRKVITNK